jgi:hypothetical protein
MELAEKEAEKEDHIEDDVDMGFGDMDEEEKEAGGGEEEAEDAADFAVLGEEHDDDDREAAKSEPVELEVAEKLDLDDMRINCNAFSVLGPLSIVELKRRGRRRRKTLIIADSDVISARDERPPVLASRGHSSTSCKLSRFGTNGAGWRRTCSIAAAHASRDTPLPRIEN